MINQPEKKERRLVAIDETVIKLENEQIYVWVAIDVDTKECLAVWLREEVGLRFILSLERYFNIARISQK